MNIRNQHVIKIANNNSIRKKFLQIIHSYYAVCVHCGYSGNDWPASGECPSCGEIN